MSKETGMTHPHPLRGGPHPAGRNHDGMEGYAHALRKAPKGENVPILTPEIRSREAWDSNDLHPCFTLRLCYKFVKE